MEVFNASGSSLTFGILPLSLSRGIRSFVSLAPAGTNIQVKIQKAKVKKRISKTGEKHSVKNHLELRIVLFLHRLKLSCEIFMSRQHLTQPHKSPHDFDIHMNSTFTVENGRQHGNALFCKDKGSIPTTTTPFV